MFAMFAMSACDAMQRAIVRMSYYYALLLGLLPVPINSATMAPRSLKPTRGYLVYSVLVHSVSLVAISIIASDIYQYNMPGRVVLRTTYTVTNLTKLVAVLLLIAEIWCKRAQFIEALLEYNAFVRRHPRLPSDCEERRFARLVVWQFITGSSYCVLASVIFLAMHSTIEHSLLGLVLVNFMLMTYVLTVMSHFYHVLCRLHDHFAYINRELVKLQQYLRQFSGDGGNERDAEELARCLSALGTMHLDCFRLTQQIFRLSGVACASIMLRFFFTNVRIVYYAVLFGSQRFAAGSWTVLTETTLIVCFYGDIWLLVSGVEAVLTSCNHAGSLLRQSSESLQLLQYPCLMRELENFADHLRCHKLVFRVCGLFKFDKEASLRFFLSVLVKVSVLVQFDLCNEAQSLNRF